nr:zinc finger, CCHC-type [Tanacetum cinerariifolium]
MDAAMKHMASSFAKLEKFDGVDFRRWQKKMHFMLSSMSVVYVLTTLMLEDGGENPTVKQVRKRAKMLKLLKSYGIPWKPNIWLRTPQVSCIIDKLPPLWKDFKHTLKHLKEELTLIELASHVRIEESLRVHDSDKPKGNNVSGPLVVNMVEHNKSSRYNDNKGKRKHHDTRANPNKKPKFTCWKCGKPRHLKKDCKAGNVGNKANGSSTKRSEDGPSNPLKAFISTSKLNDSIIWHARLCHVYFKRMQDMSKDGLIPSIDMDTEKCERGIECIFVGYAEHSKAFRFYVIEPNNSVAINSIIESKEDIFDEHGFSSVPRPSQRFLVKGTKDYGGLVVSGRVTDEIVQQSEPQLRKSKRHKTPKDFGHEFQLYLIEGTRDEGFKQKSGVDYFNTYASMARISTIRLLIAMASIHNLIIHQMDVKTAFLNGKLEKEVYMNQPLGFIMPGNENMVCKLIKFDASGEGVIICLYVDDMLIFGTDQVQVDLTKEFLSSRFSMKDMGKADVILGIRIKHESNGIAISQSHYIEKVLKKFNYFNCTPVSTPLDTCQKLMPNRAPASNLDGAKYLKKTMDYRLVYFGYPSVLEGYTDASWICNTEDDSSTSGWVFLPGGGVISWTSKKQTCITGSTMESEFVALAATGKEAEWLKNLLFEIPLWVKPMAPISINCDSAATLAKAYSQMYNEKSRHLYVRHSMIRELIMNRVEDEVVNFSMVNFFEKVLSRSMNKEEPPMEDYWKFSSVVGIYSYRYLRMDVWKCTPRECLLQAITPDKQKIIIEGMISWENNKRMAKAANARFSLVKEAAGDLREASVSPFAAADTGKGVPGVSPAATKDY